MPFICDFHIHSKYSRATSKEMQPEQLAKWAKLKGISMLGTGDFTHPAWFSELKEKLEEVDYGVYRFGEVDFVLTTEVSNIYFKTGRVRKIHNMIFAPSFEVAQEINKALYEYGNLSSDGRPILRLECNRLVKLVLSISPDAFIVPGHIWTPHFSLFGANSGFDSIEECFEDQTDKIFALETGLSSDPKMNWRWSKLDRFTLVSNSDSHSPPKIGREANVFKDKINYRDLMRILKDKDNQEFLYTIEFFPEEGKYHWDGHRACKARLSPSEAMKINNKCPHCGRNITVGVMHRLETLVDREDGYVLETSPAFKNFVPLIEIIADSLGVGPESASAQNEYFQLVKNLGSEFRILLELEEDQINKSCPPKIARGILNVRKGRVEIFPGYDGEYGKVKISKEGEEKQEKQLSFF